MLAFDLAEVQFLVRGPGLWRVDRLLILGASQAAFARS
jgi:hypothetical protein